MHQKSLAPYELGLVAFAAHADLLTQRHQPAENRAWQDSFTAQIITALTETDDELRGRVFPEGFDPAGFDPADIDADSIREGIIERICDDVLCDLSPTYEIGEDPDTGAPTLTAAPAGKVQ